MRRLFVLAVVCCLIFACGAARLMADSAEWNATYSTLDSQVFVHDDDEPFKGFAKITAYNDTDEYWTDFHMQIGSVNGSDISAILFLEGIIDGVNYDPTSSQSGLTWSINNNSSGSVINLYFASNPVAPGDEAWFKVYTDNTVNKVRFGVCAYPTTDAIPEPGSMLALFSGLAGFAGFALRRKH